METGRHRNRVPRSAFLGGVALTVVVSTSWFSGAAHLPVADPRETDGRLDVRRADVVGTRRPRWKIATYRAWTAREIWDRGFLLVRLDTFGDERFDYYGLVRSTGRRLRGDLYRDRRRKSDYRVVPLQVWRSDRRSISVRIPLSYLSFGATRVHYSWAVQTLFTGPACRRACFDLAPDAGAVLEPRTVAPTPSPSPSAGPTPSPSSDSEHRWRPGV